MRQRYHQLILMLLGGLMLLLVACRERVTAAERLVFKVGVIASLSGSSHHRGVSTVECARVIAEYYNEHGGVEVDGARYRVDLRVEDDGGDPVRAFEIASDFVREGDIHYVIGPSGGAICDAVAPVLDSAEILYVYYDDSDRLVRSEGRGILGEPHVVQLFAHIADYLEGNDEVLSACVLAGDSRSAMHLKLQVERNLKGIGVDVVGFSRFDVTEEVFDPSGSPESIRSCMASVVEKSPDAVILCGLRDGVYSLALSHLRSSGYSGAVMTRSPQDPNDFEAVELMADRLLLAGVFTPVDEQSDYYLNLKNRYLDRELEWSADTDLKLYALEWILRGVAHSGRSALSSSEHFVDSYQFMNPFFKEERVRAGVVVDSFPIRRQLPVPVSMTKYNEGRVQVMHSSDFSF